MKIILIFFIGLFLSFVNSLINRIASFLTGKYLHDTINKDIDYPGWTDEYLKKTLPKESNFVTTLEIKNNLRLQNLSGMVLNLEKKYDEIQQNLQMKITDLQNAVKSKLFKEKSLEKEDTKLLKV